MNQVYSIKKDKKDELSEYIRQLITSQCFMSTTGSFTLIAISSISIDNANHCSNDIYGFNFNTNNYGSKCINVLIYLYPKSDNTPLIIDETMRGYDYYTTSNNITIKLSNFLNNNPKWSNITDWAEPTTNKVRCKYINTYLIDNEQTIGFKRPDNKEYILDIPNEFLENGLNFRRVVGGPSLHSWIKSMEESLTTKYYRELAIDDLYDIKRNQTIYVDGTWFEYDYNDGLVEVFSIQDYPPVQKTSPNNLISKRMIELGLINIDSLSNNTKIVNKIEKSLFERYDKELKVNKIKVILSQRSDKIKI